MAALAETPGENPEISEFKRKLDAFFDEFADAPIEDVNALDRLRDRKLPLIQEAERLGLIFKLELIHAEARRKERKLQSKEAT